MGAAMERFMDLSELMPPEPLERILGELPGVRPGDFLRVRLHREPLLAYPLLEQAGFRWHTDIDDTNGVEVYIWRDGDRLAEDAMPARRT